MVFLSLTLGRSHGLLLSLLSLLSSMPSLDAGYFIPAFSLSASCLGWTSWSSKPLRNHRSILWLKPNNAFPCTIPLKLACLHQYLAFSPSPSKLIKVGVSGFLVSLFINISNFNIWLQPICFGVINCSIFCWCVWVFCFFSAISNLIDSGERKVYPCLLSYLTNIRAALFLRTETQQVCQIVGYLCIAIANILNIACLTIHLDRFFLQHISTFASWHPLEWAIKTL